jgi:serine/threonine protein kinase
VLVRFSDSGNPDVRLFKFQLGRREASSGTQHRSVLQVDSSKLYQAPELFEDPAATSPVTDVFSLGALAYFLLTGSDPAPTWMDLLVQLRERGALDPLRVSNGIPPAVAQAVEKATRFAAALRENSAGKWAELLLDAATAPDAPAIDEVSPFDAKARDTLGAGRFEVQGVLGRGATSHVLKVTDERRGGRAFALKVSLEERHDERLRAEAEALRKLDDRRIVRLEDELSIAGRTALLLSIAGSRTLQAQLAAEGPVSLDFACRYGEDLLDSLAHLEETSVPHRDIKPANLGVGASNGRKSNHLVLFDFSLVGVPPEEIGVGTAVYRDPFLVERQRWDAAGDRWSAAVTLHEMLTGERPHFSGPALDPSSMLVLAPERFEVGREELVEFFTRALARDADDRFGSAEAMKRAWSVCFAERSVRAGSPAPTRSTSATPAGRGGAAATPGVTREVLVDATIDGELAAANDLDAHGLPAEATVSGDPESSERVRGTPAIDYAAIAPEQPIAQLPLSARARNGLERAGMVHARDLLSLPDNHVSAVRGVGRSVAQEILGFREKWRVARAVAEVTAAPFLDAYAGPNLDVSRCDGISDAVARVLGDGALKTLAQVAAAPAPRVEALCFAAGATPQALRDVLAREAERAAEAKLPTSLESWIALLFDGRSKARGYVRALYGLEGPGAGRLDVTGAELAKLHAINPVNIYVAVAKQRATWIKLEALPQLLDRCAALLEPSAGLLPLREAAQQLLAVLPHAAATPDELRVAQAAALWRVLAEATAESPTLEPRILLERIDRSDQGSLWVARDAARLDEVRRLGKSADALAARDVLASPAEAQRVLLQELDPGSDLGQLPAERLVSLAASASRSAAASAHLEIYPQGMATERALRHSAAILTGPLTQQDVERRVWGRYPQAAPLPDAARWPALLAQVGFTWDGQHFQPKSAGTGSTHGTATRFTPHREPPSEIELAARDFHALVQSAIEQGDVRLFAVPSRHARQATQKLAREFARFRLETVSLDHVLFEEMQSIARSKSIKLEALYRADAEGAHGNHWHNLRRVAEEAASQLAARWLPGLRTAGAAPRLFVQLGLVARYGLTPLLEALTHADTAASVLFLIAGDSTTGFAVNHTLTVPGVLPSHCTRLSSAWLHADPDATRERAPLQRVGGA